jgi:nicotinamidase-related amidase
MVHSLIEQKNKKEITMKDAALVIIDTQVGMVEASYKGQEILDNIKNLLTEARATQTPIIFIRHDGSKGDALEPGTPGWAIHPAIAPKEGEPIISKRASDSFYDTTLKRELEARGIKHLIVVGGATEWCVDTTIRRALVEGYDVLLVSDGHMTEDYDGAVLTAAQRIAQLNHFVTGFSVDDRGIVPKPTSEVVMS